MPKDSSSGENPGATVGADGAGSAGLVLKGIQKVLGGRVVVDGLDLEVGRGELTCLLGPSGCGKTTTLRMIGGFLAPDAGEVEIDGTAYTRTPPERRPTAMVFQNYALWPHMNVFKNIAFGLRLRKLPKAEIAERVEKTLELVNLTKHIRSFPAQISGGEQQRVALARALVLEPKVLLLDEPLSNLDAKLRLRVREDIREIQQRVGITTVFVTHDQDEALAISDRIAVMNDGRIEQYADAHALYRRPATRFVADFIGTMNLLDGRTTGSGIALASGTVIPCDDISARVEGDAVIGVRPEDVRLGVDGGGDRGTDGVPAEVVRVVPRGHYSEVHLDVAGTAVRAFAAADFESPATVVRVTFARALIYADGVLLNAHRGR